jgi:ankyrin repeat protein
LERASAEGHVEVVQLLLEHGADAKAQDEKKITPMHVASANGQLGVARVLLEHGADVKAQNKDNETPLHWAKEKRLLGFSSSTGQMRTPWTSRIGHRCIICRSTDMWKLFEFFSSMV